MQATDVIRLSTCGECHHALLVGLWYARPGDVVTGIVCVCVCVAAAAAAAGRVQLVAACNAVTAACNAVNSNPRT